MVKEILENAKRQIEAQRNQQLNVISQRVKVERVVPYNTELDKKKDRAIAEEREKANAQVAQIQAEFNAKKEEIEKATEETKKAFEKSSIETACAEINKACDDAIKALDNQIANTKE